jgi:alcohol dehydrogenase class IV
VDGATRLKRLVLSPHIVPNIAVLDPELTLTMPKTVTAYSGFDALTHAVEALVTKATNEFARANALYAIRLIFESLPVAYMSGERTAREKMHSAATMASLAASNSFAGLAHGMDQVGPLFGLPHGLVCAVLLPHTIAFNSGAGDGGAALSSYRDAAKAIGLDGNAFLERVKSLQRDLNVPCSFRECGVSEQEYFAAMPVLVEATLSSRAVQLGPRVPTAEEARALFERAYWGKD